jgi:DNA-binding transcriptional MocR family regulator
MDGQVIKLTRGTPPTSTFPTGKIAECASAVLAQHGDEVLQYGPSRGFLPLREELARETNTKADQVILGGGSLNLLDLFIRLVVKPRDWVFVEKPTYDRPLILLRRAGARVRGLPMEEDGLNTRYLTQRLEEGVRPVFLYVIPDFQNPSGTVLALEKRHRIIELARQYDFWIVEDLPYRKLRYRGDEVLSFLEMAPDRVLQMSSFSKLISPGLRVGHLIVPEPLAGPLAKIAEETTINASYLNQAIVYEFIERGWLEPQIEELKVTYQPLLDATLASLEDHMGDLATWHRPDGGFFVGTMLNAPVDAGVLQQKAHEAGLLLTDGRTFFPDGDGDRFVRLPFCALSEREIDEGIAGLAGVVRSLG